MNRAADTFKLTRFRKTFSRAYCMLWPHRPLLHGRNFRKRHFALCSRCHSRTLYSTRRVNLVKPVFLEAENYLSRTAVIDQNGKFSYEALLHFSSYLSKELLELTGENTGDLELARVAFLCENDMSYVVTQWATWIAGGVVVPLCPAHPASELQYFVEDSQASVLVTTESLAGKLSPIAEKLGLPLKTLTTADYAGSWKEGEDNYWLQVTGIQTKTGKRARGKTRFEDLLAANKYKHTPAMIVYTSGTTGPPKGVVMTHGNIHAQVMNMISAWGWSKSDVILHVLPLHHVHGIVNVLMTPLYTGATCVMLPKFEAKKVWSMLLNPLQSQDGLRINLFMAVPTIYAKLIEAFETTLYRGRGSRLAKEYIKAVCLSRIRLMVSGSAALPQPIMDQWKQITGHTLLERYGMTEIGMALTNPLDGARIAGSVGKPFPSVEVCIAQPDVYSYNGYSVITKGDSKRTMISEGSEDEQGELMVKGPSVFKQYWNRPSETEADFTRDGWFKTGDTAIYENGVYRIVGRTSVDVIKSGGYKISALDVERHLLGHPLIKDCCVVGLPDITWGQRVAAVITVKPDYSLSSEELVSWSRTNMPPYQIPSVWKFMDTIPRNAMGKVNKKELVNTVFPTHKRRDL